jgi:TatD family-associated radical SAM protein
MDQNVVYWLGNSLYLNITNRCSNNCYFCFRHYLRGIAGFHLKLKDEPCPERIIEQIERYMPMRRWKEVVFCGFGEPTMRLDCILEVTRWIKRYHPNMKVRLDTNGHGYLLNPGRDAVKEIREAGINAVSVSLNGHDKKTYQYVCKPSLKDAYKSVLSFIVEAKRANLEVEVTAVRIPEIDISKIQNLASQLGVKFRARDYIPCFY